MNHFAMGKMIFARFLEFATNITFADQERYDVQFHLEQSKHGRLHVLSKKPLVE
jgi:hypothetical protein